MADYDLNVVKRMWKREPDEWVLKAINDDSSNYSQEVLDIIIEEAISRGLIKEEEVIKRGLIKVENNLCSDNNNILKKSLRNIKIGGVTGLILGTFTLLIWLYIINGNVIIGFEYLQAYIIVDVILIILLSVGIFLKSRLCSVTIFIYSINNTIYQYTSSHDNSSFIGILYGLLLFFSIKGTFAYHQLSRKMGIQQTHRKAKTIYAIVASSITLLLIIFSIYMFLPKWLGYYREKSPEYYESLQTSIEVGLLKIPLYEAIKNNDPNTFKQITTAMLVSYELGKSESEIKDNIKLFLMEHIFQFLPKASDEAIIKFGKFSSDMLVELTAIDPLLSYKWLFPKQYGKINIDEYLNEEKKEEMLNMMTEIYQTGTSSPVLVNDETLEKGKILLDEVRKKLSEKYGDDINLMESPESFDNDKGEYCQIVIDFYQEVLKLPKEGAALLLRYLYKEDTFSEDIPAKPNDTHQINTQNNPEQKKEIKSNDICSYVTTGDTESVKRILESDPNLINYVDEDGDTLLHLSVTTFGNKETVELLISYGADVNDVNNHNATPLHNSLSSVGDCEIAKVLIDKGANVNAYEDITGSVPIHFAVDKGCINIIDLLLAKGADINAKNKKTGGTALHHLTQEGQEDKTDIIQHVVIKGANINEKDDLTGGTPLHYASMNGYINIVKYLIDNGADPFAKATTGEATPLMLAEMEEHKDVADILRKHMGKVADLLDSIGDIGFEDKNVLNFVKKLKDISPEINKQMGNEIKKKYSFDWFSLQMVSLKMVEQQFRALDRIDDANKINKAVETLDVAWLQGDLYEILYANFYNIELETVLNKITENMSEEEIEKLSVDVRPVKALAERLLKQSR